MLKAAATAAGPAPPRRRRRRLSRDEMQFKCLGACCRAVDPERCESLELQKEALRRGLNGLRRL